MARVSVQPLPKDLAFEIAAVLGVSGDEAERQRAHLRRTSTFLQAAAGRASGRGAAGEVLALVAAALADVASAIPEPTPPASEPSAWRINPDDPREVLDASGYRVALCARPDDAERIVAAHQRGAA